MDVLVATALIAILYAIAVPRYRELQGPYASSSAASVVASAFQAARMRAIATNSNVRLTYNSGTKSYTIDRQIGGSWTTEVTNQMPTGVTLSASGNPQFSRTGVLNGDFTVTVTANGTTRTVNINVLGKTTIS